VWLPALATDDEDDDTAAGSQGDQDKGGSQGGEGGAKPKKGRRGAAQPDLEPSSTLADAETLKDKKADNTFESDPLFNRTTKLFDENSASGGWGRPATYPSTRDWPGRVSMTSTWHCWMHDDVGA
jgi:hypothetical protein